MQSFKTTASNFYLINTSRLFKPPILCNNQVSTAVLCRSMQQSGVQYRAKCNRRRIETSAVIPTSYLPLDTWHSAVLHCTVNHHTVPHFTTFYCTTLHCTSPHCTTFYYMLLYYTAPYITTLYYILLHFTVQNCIVHHLTVLHLTTFTILYSTIHH